MAKSINSAYTELITQLKNIDGLRNVPDNPLENTTVFPYLEPWPPNGEWKGLAVTTPIGTHKFPFAVHVSRAQGLSKAYDQLLDFPERIYQQFMFNNKTLNGTVVGVEGITWDMRPGKVGGGDKGIDTLMIMFELTVKI